MGHPTDDLIQRFYFAFSRLDGETMAARYASRTVLRSGVHRSAR